MMAMKLSSESRPCLGAWWFAFAIIATCAYGAEGAGSDTDKKAHFSPLTPAERGKVNCRSEFAATNWVAMWYESRPYAYTDRDSSNAASNASKLDGIITNQLIEILTACCTEGLVDNIDFQEINHTDVMTPSSQISKELIYGNAAIGFPFVTPTRPALANHFVAVVPSPGAVYLVRNMYAPISILSAVSGAWLLLCFVLVSAAVAGILIWGIESLDRKQSMFAKNFLPGIFDGFWFAIVTMTSVGFGDITPRSKTGKLIGLLWMVTGTISLAIFTASVTTSMTTSTLAVDTDIRGARVAVVLGSDASRLAILNGAKVQFESDSPLDAIKAVVNGSCEGVVLDQLTAGDLINNSPDPDVNTLRVAKLLMSQIMHGILFSPNRSSGLLEQCADLVMEDQEHSMYLQVEELIAALQSQQVPSDQSATTAGLFSQHKNVVYITCYVLIFVFFFTWGLDCVFRKSVDKRSKHHHHHRSQRSVSRHHHGPWYGNGHAGGYLSNMYKSHLQKSATVSTLHPALNTLPETERLLSTQDSIQYGSVEEQHQIRQRAGQSLANGTAGRQPTARDIVGGRRSTTPASTAGTGTDRRRASSDDSDDDDYGASSGKRSTASSSPVVSPKQQVYMKRPSYKRRVNSSPPGSVIQLPPSIASDGQSTEADVFPPVSPPASMEEFVVAEQNHELERMEGECRQMLQTWSLRRRDMLLRHQQERSNFRLQQEQRQAAERQRTS